MWLGKDGIYNKYVKRALDVLCALLTIGVFCWLYAILALLVKIKLGTPVIYKAKRPGKIDPATGKEKIFELYKFRSMTNEKNSEGKLLPDTKRLTKFGRILRATSLDELPEIVNILKGDMSIIGPRPLSLSYLNYYTAEEHHRHDVRPGLTGLAQVSGRNNLSWEEKFHWDLKYIENLSFSQDMKILIITVVKVFKHEGIGQGEAAPTSMRIERKERMKGIK